MPGLMHDEAGFYWRPSWDSDDAELLETIWGARTIRFPTGDGAVAWLDANSDRDMSDYLATGEAISNLTREDRRALLAAIRDLDDKRES